MQIPEDERSSTKGRRTIIVSLESSVWSSLDGRNRDRISLWVSAAHRGHRKLALLEKAYWRGAL